MNIIIKRNNLYKLNKKVYFRISMSQTNVRILKLILFIQILFVLSCNNSQNSDYSNEDGINEIDSNLLKFTLPKTLKVVMHNNSTSYFVYRGTPMGFHYDLIKIYAKERGMEVEIIVENEFLKSLELISSGDADVCAFDVTQTNERIEEFLFTIPIGYNKQVLVQRSKSGRNNSDSSDYIKDFIDLDNKSVHVQTGAIFREQIEYLENISATSIRIIDDSLYTMEELIQQVSDGEIDYTVCDERVAKANATYNLNIDYSTPISIKQKLSWTLALGSDSLLADINNWLSVFTESRRFAVITNKYFKTKKNSFYTHTEFSPYRGGSLTPYDNIIKANAKIIGWDWRLLAALIYQESRFNPDAGSWAGAMGLMQLMPSAAKTFGLEDPFDPKQNIEAGARYLNRIQKRFAKDSTISKEDIIKFTMASYNVGMGHVTDARRLAKKHSGSNNTWTNSVDTFMMLKQKPKYYNDPVVKYGYCKGSAPYYYVEKIMSIYSDYKNVIDL